MINGLKRKVQIWRFGYDKSKQRAKEIYSEIGTIPCHALGGDMVAFTRVGFSHLVRKGRIPRTKGEQKRRFALIAFAEEIISDTNANIKYDRSEIKVVVDRHGNKTLVKSVADFWTFTSIIGDTEVKVVVRQLNSKQKHFLSIYGGDVTLCDKCGVISNTIKKSLNKR